MTFYRVKCLFQLLETAEKCGAPQSKAANDIVWRRRDFLPSAEKFVQLKVNLFRIIRIDLKQPDFFRLFRFRIIVVDLKPESVRDGGDVVTWGLSGLKILFQLPDGIRTFSLKVDFHLKDYELIESIDTASCFGSFYLLFQFNLINLNPKAHAKEVHQQGTPMVMMRILTDGIRDLRMVGGQKARKFGGQRRKGSLHGRSSRWYKSILKTVQCPCIFDGSEPNCERRPAHRGLLVGRVAHRMYSKERSLIRRWRSISFACDPRQPALLRSNAFPPFQKNAQCAHRRLDRV